MARCFGIFTSFQEQTSFLTPPLWEEQKLVANTLCHGLERRRPTTPQRPLCEEERKARKGGKKRRRLAPRGRKGAREEGEEGSRGQGGEAASADCQAVSKCQRLSLSESRTSRLETPNKQRLSHRVNVGSDKPQRRPPSCDVANQRAEACGGGDNPRRRPLVLLGEAAARLTATSEEKHFASEREGGRRWRGNVDKLPLCGAVWTQEDRVSSPADVLWR